MRGDTPKTAEDGSRGGRRIKVCILIPRLRIGGAEVQVLHLLRNLDSSRFEVHLCLLNSGDESMEVEARRYVESVELIDFRMRFLPMRFCQLYMYLRRKRFDVLHSHLPLADTLGRAAGRLARVPVLITTEHGKHLWKPFWHLGLDRILNGVTDARICVSHDILELRMSREGTPRDKLSYIPNAVDPAPFKSPARGRASVMAEFGWGMDDELVVTIGRLVPAKNYQVLVEAIGRLRESSPGVRCLIVGDGGERGVIEERIGALGLEESLRITGYRRDTADLLAAADLFALSSIREGLPVSLLEAMAAERAVVATRVGGIPDAIEDGVNGLLVQPDDPEALAAAMAKVLGDAELRRSLGAAASQTVEERFAVARAVRMVSSLYESLFERKVGGRLPKQTA